VSNANKFTEKGTIAARQGQENGPQFDAIVQQQLAGNMMPHSVADRMARVKRRSADIRCPPEQAANMPDNSPATKGGHN
jgi:hypothetical protein